MSKSSKSRPLSISQKEYDKNFDQIFRTPSEIEDAKAEDEAFDMIQARMEKDKKQFDEKVIMKPEFYDL